MVGRVSFKTKQKEEEKLFYYKIYNYLHLTRATTKETKREWNSKILYTAYSMAHIFVLHLYLSNYTTTQRVIYTASLRKKKHRMDTGMFYRWAVYRYLVTIWYCFGTIAKPSHQITFKDVSVE